MPVNPNTRGYDKSQTLQEQIAGVRKRLADYIAKGRDGTPVVQALRQRVAELEGFIQQDVDTRARLDREEAAERAKNPSGTVVAQR